GEGHVVGAARNFRHRVGGAITAVDLDVRPDAAEIPALCGKNEWRLLTLNCIIENELHRRLCLAGEIRPTELRIRGLNLKTLSQHGRPFYIRVMIFVVS